LNKIVAGKLPDLTRLNCLGTARIRKFPDKGGFTEALASGKNTLNELLSLRAYDEHFNRPVFYLVIIRGGITVME
jgi:hypothetical protein